MSSVNIDDMSLPVSMVTRDDKDVLFFIKINKLVMRRHQVKFLDLFIVIFAKPGPLKGKKYGPLKWASILAPFLNLRCMEIFEISS